MSDLPFYPVTAVPVGMILGLSGLIVTVVSLWKGDVKRAVLTAIASICMLAATFDLAAVRSEVGATVAIGSHEPVTSLFSVATGSLLVVAAALLLSFHALSKMFFETVASAFLLGVTCFWFADLAMMRWHTPQWAFASTTFAIVSTITLIAVLSAAQVESIEETLHG